jgi:hypothetical protein
LRYVLSASPQVVHSPLSRVNHLGSSKIRPRRLVTVCSLDEEPPPSTIRAASDHLEIFLKAEVEIKKELKRKKEEI